MDVRWVHSRHVNALVLLLWSPLEIGQTLNAATNLQVNPVSQLPCRSKLFYFSILFASPLHWFSLPHKRKASFLLFPLFLSLCSPKNRWAHCDLSLSFFFFLSFFSFLLSGQRGLLSGCKALLKEKHTETIERIASPPGLLLLPLSLSLACCVFRWDERKRKRAREGEPATRQLSDLIY